MGVLEIEHLPILLEVKVTTEVRVMIVLRETQDDRTEMSGSSQIFLL